jgi:hypothetical protein
MEDSTIDFMFQETTNVSFYIDGLLKALKFVDPSIHTLSVTRHTSPATIESFWSIYIHLDDQCFTFRDFDELLSWASRSRRPLLYRTFNIKEEKK